MSVKLVITEKPSVAMSIARTLGVRQRNEGYIEGKKYIISWCLGHLVQLADAAEYDPRYARWNLDDLPILPKQWQYQVLPDRQQQFDVVQRLMNDPRVESLICATDAGREGELIFRLVYQQAGCTKPFQRLWISSMEESAIREGFDALRDGREYDRLYASALCRSQADWAVGINATRLYTSLYRKPLSVGRVQTPALGMLVEREKKIAAFAAEKSYSVRLDCGAFSAESENMLQTDAETLQTACTGQTAAVEKLEAADKTVNAPKLYDLTTLQRDANRLHGLTAQDTLDTMQSLYEKRFVTYPRTDSRYIPADMEESTRQLVPLVCAHRSWAKNLSLDADLSRCVNDAKVGDHHAILPTRQISSAQERGLSEWENLVLDLVCQRLILAVSPKHVYHSVRAELRCAGQLFVARGKSIVQEGWKAIQRQIKAGAVEEDEETEEAKSLPELAVGDHFECASSNLIEHETTPPRHYTEDTLLSAMETAGNEELDKSLDTEKKGLGTPATRAGIIEKLIKSGLVERKKKQLLPTEKGVKLISVAPTLMKSAQLTAQWENQLTEIAAGTREADRFMDDITALVYDIMKEKTAQHDRYYFAEPRQDDREKIGVCPRCGGTVYETKSNFRCENNQCGFALWKDAHFFSNKKKVLTKTAAKSLLKKGRAKIRGFTSERTGKKYDATVVMEDTGTKYVRYHLEFDDEGK